MTQQLKKQWASFQWMLCRDFFFFTWSKIITGPKVQSAEGNMTIPQAVTCQGPSSAKWTPPACLCGSHTFHKFVSLQRAK